MTSPEARSYWKVHEPEAGLRLVVTARPREEAQAFAWHRWYGRNPKTELEALMRAALTVTQSEAPAE